LHSSCKKATNRLAISFLENQLSSSFDCLITFNQALSVLGGYKSGAFWNID